MANDNDSVAATFSANAAALAALRPRVLETRRQLQSDRAHLAMRARHTFDHLRGLAMLIEDHLSTSVGPLTIYRQYLLDDRGNILCDGNGVLRRDTHARGDTEAIQTGRDWCDAHQAGHPNPAGGFEVWRGRRLVLSSCDRILGVGAGSATTAVALSGAV